MPTDRPTDTHRRVGFLYNHEALHQVPHSAPIAAALAGDWSGVAVEAIATRPALAAAFTAIAVRSGGPAIPVRLLSLPAWQKAGARLLDPILPFSRMMNLRTHAETLAGYDALVVTEATSLRLKRRLGRRCPPLFWVSHGAGDRSVGFRRELGQFDRLLVAGEKLRARMIAENIASPERIEIVGYAKFDAVRLSETPRPRVFDNGRPTVLYNPHFEPYLSSWWRMGEAVLDWFIANPHYNLIFAPHVMLFKRRLALSLEHAAIRRRRALPARFRTAPNILIDLDSDALYDMRYTRAADIYLGDVSSQVYEFLVTPRPCLFLNAHGAAWRDDPNYAMWRSGPVLDDAGGLGHALTQAIENHAQYRPAQIELAAATFDRAQEPAAPRAAAAIARALGL
jgi:hypothetical protein